MTKIVSRIKTLLKDKKSGYIAKLNQEEASDFYFLEKELLNVKYEDLREGMSVKFEPNKNFANKIELEIKDDTNTYKLYHSTIKKLLPEQKRGYIAKLHSNDSQDFLFCEKELIGIDFDSLQENMEVEFEINGHFANKVRCTNKIIQPSICDTHNQKEKNEFEQLISPTIKTIYDAAKSISDPYIFEDYVHTILKMLISEVYPSLREKQAGLFDGLFKYKNLEVVYDCTISKNYQDYKKQQIENYITQIQQQSITINTKRINLSNNSIKQIWIITPYKTNILEEYNSGIMDILIKEVSIFSLINLLNKKLLDVNYDLTKAVDDLKNIE